MKKKLRVLSAVLVGVLVFFGATAVTANSSMQGGANSTNAVKENLISENSRALETFATSSMQISAAQSLVEIHTSSDPLPITFVTPSVLVEISPTKAQEAFWFSEEDDFVHNQEVVFELGQALVSEFSLAEKKVMARVVYAEARGEKFEGQVAVAAVILNRYESGKFGKSIKSIAFASNQFAITEKYNDLCMSAVEEAIESRELHPDNMFFFQVSKSRTWRNFVYFKRIGNHSFYCAAD